MKDVQIKLTYEQVELNQEDVQRRLEAAFDVLFEEIFAVEENNTGRQPDNHSNQFSPAEVFSHDR